MLAPEQENEAQVRREDQDRINRFARLNARLHEVQRELQKYQKELETLDDASTELLMLNETSDNVLLVLGESFLETTEEEATHYCETQVEKVQAKVTTLNAEKDDILQQQAELKQLLYGRFGKSINLEDK